MSINLQSYIETLLGKQAARLLEAFENIADAYLLMDLKGNVLKMNTAAVDLFGYDTDEGFFDVTSIIYPDEYTYTMNSFDELIKKGVFKDYKARIITKNDDIRWIHINSNLVYNTLNEPVAVQGIIRDVTQEKHNIDYIKQQTNELNVIIDNAPHGIVLSQGKNIFKTNKAFQDLIGYSEDDLLKLSIKDISSPDDFKKTEEFLKQIISGEIDKFSVEKRYLRKDKTFFWAKTTVSKIRFDNDDIILVALIEDITPKREKELIVNAINDIAKSILGKTHVREIAQEVINNITAYLDTEDCVIYSVNQEAKFMEQVAAFGNKLDTNNTIIDKLILKIGEGIAGDVAKKGVAEIINDTGKDKRYIIDGGNRLSEICVPIICEGIVVGVIDSEHPSANYFTEKHLNTLKSIADLISMKFKNGMEVIEKEKVQKQLEAQKLKYSSIIENMNLGLVEVDTSGKVLMVNKSFEDMSGFSREELLGKNPENVFLTRESSDIIASENQERLKGTSGSYELVVVTKNGDAKYWLISGAPNYNSNGEVIGSIGIHLDITNLKLLEAQKEMLLQKLEKNNQELQEYAHVVSHDLKSPLRNIAAITSWIKEDFKDVIDDEGLKNFTLIDETLAKMEHLIEGVLNYSSIDKRPYVDKKVDLDSIVATMLNTIYIPNHITVNIIKPLPELNADPIRMQQLFQNLLSNAVNYIDKEKGRVEIDYKENETHFEFSISDNGIGIPKKYHRKIFNLFQTLETKKSTGIGLSIVKRIIEIYEGKIWVESVLKEGTTFYFTLKK